MLGEFRAPILSNAIAVVVDNVVSDLGVCFKPGNPLGERNWGVVFF